MRPLSIFTAAFLLFFTSVESVAQTEITPQNSPASAAVTAEKKSMAQRLWKRFSDPIAKELRNNASAIKQFSKLKTSDQTGAFLKTKNNKEKNNVLLYAALYAPLDMTASVLKSVKDKNVVNQAFLIALSRLDYDGGLTVGTFFDAGASANTKDYVSKMTPLMLAAIFSDDAAAVGAILNGTRDIDAADTMNMTALMYAARYASNPEIPELLIAGGARTDKIDVRQMTALHHLRQNDSMPRNKNYDALLMRLGEKKFVSKKPKSEELAENILRGNLEKARSYLKSGVNINEKDAAGGTLLTKALLSPNALNATRFLIEEGADVNIADTDGTTPLMRALTVSKNPELILLLLKAKADVNQADNEKDTPLKAAFVYGHGKAVVQALIDAGADPKAKDRNGKTPLDYAKEKSRLSGFAEYKKIIKSLETKTTEKKPSREKFDFIKSLKRNDFTAVENFIVQNKNDINVRNTDGDTLLYQALSATKKPEIIKMLLDNGADVSLRKTNGETVLIFAVKNTVPPEIIALLITAGADTEDKDASGKNPADYLSENADYSQDDFEKIDSLLTNGKKAAVVKNNYVFNGDFLSLVKKGDDEDIRLALASGATPNTQDENGNTPLLFLLQDPTDAFVLKRLLAAGADPNLSNHTNLRPLTYAAERKQSDEILAVLAKAGAEFNAETRHPNIRNLKGMKNNSGHARSDREQSELREKTARFVLTADDSFIDDVYYVPAAEISKFFDDARNEKRTVNDRKSALKTLKDKNGKTPLMTAATRFVNAEDVIRTLIDAGAPLDEADNNGETALFYAVKSNASPAVISLLIQSGANVDFFNKRGRTPLVFALNKPALFSTLMKNGANINAKDKKGLSLLANSLNDSNFPKLIEAGADVNARDKDGNTILMREIIKEDASPTVIALLLQNGADVNIPNFEGETALMKTVLLYKTSVGDKSEDIRRLLNAGADIDKRDNTGKTALIKAVEKTYNVPVILTLINEGADISLQDDSLKTAADYAKNNRSLQLEKDFPEILKKLTVDKKAPEELLFEAVRKKDTDTLKEALSMGASVNAVDAQGDTALIKAAVLPDSADVIDILLNAKADVNIQNNDGDTALMKALLYKKNALVRRLTAARANVNLANKKGETPLRRAFLYVRNVSLIETLVNAGAETKKPDMFGKTALNYLEETPRLKSDPRFPVLLKMLEK